MIPLVPYEHLSIRTPVAANEVVRRLAAAVDPKPFSADYRLYQGEIASKNFKIRRIINYRNPFRPTVVGHVQEDGTGTVIEATLRLNLFMIAYMAVLFAFVILVGTVITTQVLAAREHPAFGLIPTTMLIFGYLMMQGGFAFESKKAKCFLNELAHANISSSYVS
jgi:hypothetical protein